MSKKFETLTDAIASRFQSITIHWNGRDSIQEMKDASDKQWRQMEWIGFYFEFLCRKHLSDFMEIPGPQYGNTKFDGLLEVPWDFKAHANNTSSHQIIINDKEAITKAITEFGYVGVILALGDVHYNDEQRTFKAWHDHLKGSKSRYVEKNEARGAWSRLRKVCFDLKQIAFIRITESSLGRSGSFQADFRNSNGKKRRPKVMIDLERLSKSDVRYFEY